jgi:transcriptional regulator with XRE-family HTH domain
MSETIGEQIRRHRKAVRPKMTQRQLAEATGLSERMIQDAESGKHTPQPANLTAIRRVLGIEGDPVETRASWPTDVQAFLDMLGAALSWLPEQDRLEKMREIGSRIFPPG